MPSYEYPDHRAGAVVRYASSHDELDRNTARSGRVSESASRSIAWRRVESIWSLRRSRKQFNSFRGTFGVRWTVAGMMRSGDRAQPLAGSRADAW